MTELDWNMIGIILAIVVPCVTAIVFIIRLEMRVRQLENNPIITALKQFERDHVIRLLSDLIANRVEERDG